MRGQWLFRAEVESRDGSASLRLTLRVFGADEFELSAADALGQTRWRLNAHGDQAVWVEPAHRRFCRLAIRDGLSAPGFRSRLPLEELPRLLLRRLPPEPNPSTELPQDGSAEVPDEAGRRWSGQRAGGAWTSWTLWEGERPVLWWRVDGEEAMISGRDPAFQLRWRQTAHGPLPAGAAAATPESGYREESCIDSPAA